MMKAALAILITCAASLHAQEATISGVVRVSAIEALPAANVTLALEPGKGSTQTLTDNRGSYRFSGLARGTYMLTIGRLGFDIVWIELDLAGGEQKTMPAVTLPVGVNGDCSGHPEHRRLLPPGAFGARLSGTIGFDQPPSLETPNAQVTACPRQGKCVIQRTDAAGKFAFDDLPAGRYSLNVIRDEYYTYNDVKFTVEEGWETIYPITLAKICVKDCAPPPKIELIVCE